MSDVNVLIVDDHPMFRQGLRDLVETDPNLSVLGEASDGETALTMAAEMEPNVILMDINLPTINGLQVTRKLKDQSPEINVVMITGYDDAEQVFHAFRAGASAYCPKDVSPQALLETIYAVHDGYYVVGDRTMSHDELIDWIEEKVGGMPGSLPQDDEEVFEPLTPRQMEVLELVTRGLTNKEIALRLGISHQTVKNHMTAILRKLRCQDRTQAAVYALSHGWIRLDEQRE
ncbi:MAG: response regulator transcription factor [Candidatus Promineifilaceae bacterium]|nr:response regulator transcription factor [Candidatus Promineifilaceae bacterium]